MHFAEIDSILDSGKILGKNLSTNGSTGTCKYWNNQKSLIDFTKHFPLSLKQIAVLLPVSERTLQKYATDQHLNKYVHNRLFILQKSW